MATLNPEDDGGFYIGAALLGIASVLIFNSFINQFCRVIDKVDSRFSLVEVMIHS